MMKPLTDIERQVIEHKGTESPFSGEYYLHDSAGVYCCKKCGNALYRSEDKFNAHCGWPAFDDEIKGAIKRVADLDGQRIEILCSQCDGHLGHVFEDEGLTNKNIRHCVNSISMTFKGNDEVNETTTTMMKENERVSEVATFGAGCFWCVEAIFSSLKGVLAVQSGYTGGTEEDASYQRVCSGETAHAEVLNITFDPDHVSFDELLTVFFHSHNPTTLNRQGNDVGTQYRSIVFAHTEAQKSSTLAAIEALTQQKIWSDPIVTQIDVATDFYPAEDYHNDYFSLHGEEPYCAMVIKPKLDKIKSVFADKLK